MGVTSKIGNAALLLKNAETAKHIPKTEAFTRANLSSMLQEFPSVYIKPNDSAQGKGILRVDLQSNGSYMLRSRDVDGAWFDTDFNQLWLQLNRMKLKRYYLLQQGISSITKAGNPFDIRVHMTRIKGTWIIAGMVGRLAPMESIVTNYFLEGPSTYVSELLTTQLYLSSNKAEEMITQLKSLSLQATQIISSAYPKWSEFGLDIGIDSSNHLWIYEINITPGASVFQKINYKSYLRILNLRKRAR